MRRGRPFDVLSPRHVVVDVDVKETLAEAAES